MLDWLYPQTVGKVRSKYSGEIKVTKSRGKYSVWVGGFEQSGGIYVEGVWKKALKGVSLSKQGNSLINVLVLGLGCGTLVPIILNRWPKAKIVGVEIDPIMIELGKKYFGLDDHKSLKIVLGDARKQKLSGYDFIICDAYLGGKNQLSKLKTKVPVLRNIFDPKTLRNKIILQTKTNLVF